MALADKISKLFGVTTDYLLKDEIGEEEFTDDADRAPVKRVSLAQANAFLVCCCHVPLQSVYG